MNEIRGVLAPETPVEDSGPDLKPGRSQDARVVDKTGRHGTFQGVFRPTFLTIVCVMAYLREGWVVGHAGILGAALVILLAFFIMGTSAFVLSSVSTNARAGGGGIVGIISRSLGFEAGGGIGIPLYVGHVFLVALYVYGFAEAWQSAFPHHPQMLVAYGMFAVVVAATFVPPTVTFRVQDVALVLVVASLGSALIGLLINGVAGGFNEPHLWGSFDGSGFWLLFAILFAAGGGLTTGAVMPDALRNPRRSIPWGTLAAVGVAFTIYFVLAIWYGSVAPPAELLTNYMIMVDYAAWGPIVLAAILAATFAAALLTLAAAPKMLQTLADQGIVPTGDRFGNSTHAAPSRAAVAATVLLVLTTLLVGDLDRIAVLVTLFFLLSYLSLHVLVLLEQELRLFSFRPTLQVSRWVAIPGAVVCFVAMFVISPFFSLIGLTLVAALFVLLTRRPFRSPGVARSGVLNALVDWITRQTARMPEQETARSWRPDVLIPVKSRSELDGTYRFLRLITEPNGTIRILGIRPPRPPGGTSRGSVLGMADKDLFGSKSSQDATSDRGAESDDQDSAGGNGSSDDLETLSVATKVIQSDALHASAMVIEAPNLAKGVETAVTIFRSTPSPPNVLVGFAHLYNQEKLQALVDVADEFNMGVALLHLHPDAGLRYERVLNVWLNDRGPDWEVALRMENLDLMLVLAYQISRNMGSRLRLSTIHKDAQDALRAQDFLDRLVRDARLPEETERWVRHGSLLEHVADAPQADLNLFALSREVHHALITTLVRHTGSSCLFVRDSGRESVLA